MGSKRVAFLMIFLVLPALVFSQEFKLLSPPIIDLGTVPSDTIVSGVIKFTNVGKAPLKIKKVKTSCGCTVAKLTKLIYQPGEIGEITIKFNTRGFSGTARKNITVFLEKGSPSSVRVVLQAKVIPKIAIVPRYVDFRNINLSETVVRRSFTVKNNTHKPIVLKSVKIDNPNLAIEPDHFILPPDSSLKVWVDYNVQKVGRDDTVIVLGFAEPADMLIRVPVFVSVVPMHEQLKR